MMIRRASHLLRVATTATLIAFAFACGGDSTRPVTMPAIRALAGANQSDTADAVLRQSLVVEVRDSTGAPAAAGTPVHFAAVPRGASSVSELTLESLEGATFSSAVTTSTDSRGQASVAVRLGTIAGPARVVVSVSQFALIDTVLFTIMAANPVRLSIQPTDTSVIVGRSVPFRGGFEDQFGNSTGGTPSWSISGSSAVVATSGTVTATVVGRYTITAAGPGSQKPAVAFLSVVPPLRLAGWSRNSQSIMLMDIDGRNLKTLTKVLDGPNGAHPKWMPGDKTIVFTSLVGSVQLLEILDTAGVVTPLFPNPVPNIGERADATPTFDGAWLYFGAYDTICSVAVTSFPSYCIYRSRIDGSGAELVGTADVTGTNLAPSPSPDGLHVAVAVGNPFLVDPVVRVFDLSTRTTSGWSAVGEYPSWSPDGAHIAFQGFPGPLHIVDPDGSNQRSVTSGNLQFGGPIEWTRDSRYLLARDAESGVFDLIDAQTLAVIPLGNLPELDAVTVKPLDTSSALRVPPTLP